MLSEHDFISVTVGATLDRSSMSELIKDNPLNISVAILNEVGVNVAAAEGGMNFLSGDSFTEDLVFQMSPAFTMRETIEPPPTGASMGTAADDEEPVSALPSYYLVVSMQFEDDSCIDDCKDCNACEQGCEACGDNCGHCEPCKECQAACESCSACEEQILNEYAKFFSQNTFEIKTKLLRETICADMDDDGDADGTDLGRIAEPFDAQCLDSFAPIFGY